MEYLSKIIHKPPKTRERERDCFNGFLRALRKLLFLCVQISQQFLDVKNAVQSQNQDGIQNLSKFGYLKQFSTLAW